MSRPVLWIGAADDEMGSLVCTSGCGAPVPAAGAAALTQVLRELSGDHASGGTRLRAMTQQAQALWHTRFKRPDALDAWAATIERCADRQRISGQRSTQRRCNVGGARA